MLLHIGQKICMYIRISAKSNSLYTKMPTYYRTLLYSLLGQNATVLGRLRLQLSRKYLVYVTLLIVTQIPSQSNC